VRKSSRNEGTDPLKDETAVSQRSRARRLLTDHFRCPDNLADFTVASNQSRHDGYFKFGPRGICYGQCAFETPAMAVTDPLHDMAEHICMSESSIQLPFDPDQVVNNLRYERYRSGIEQGRIELSASRIVRALYYLVRPLMPVEVRRHLQRIYFHNWDKIPFPGWPVDFSVEDILEQLLLHSMKARKIQRVPIIWFWPEGTQSCAIVTHDVETASGRDFCQHLMDLNDSFKIKSAFQVVPEKRYCVPLSFLDSIRERGFELNVHDLNHDGHLMERQEEFLRRAEHINRYGVEFGALGFRSAMLHRNLEWYEALDFSYDMSVPNVAHLDPQRGGCCTVFPFFNRKLLEIPVTMIQDYSLFHILKDYSINVWKRQIEAVAERNGLMNFIVHPDYITKPREQGVYTALLDHLTRLKQAGTVWIATPGEVNIWWRQRAEMRLVEDGSGWQVEGLGKERARIAYASEKDGRIVFELDEASLPTEASPSRSQGRDAPAPGKFYGRD
jgi:hypothetical protein